MNTTLQQLQDDLAQISASAHPTTEIYFDGAPREVTARFACGRIILDIDGMTASDTELATITAQRDRAYASAAEIRAERDGYEEEADALHKAIKRLIHAAGDSANFPAAIEAAKKLIE